jgi:hypothetical protein
MLRPDRQLQAAEVLASVALSGTDWDDGVDGADALAPLAGQCPAALKIDMDPCR